MAPRDLPKSPLAAFLRAHGAGILEAWERAERRRAPGEQSPGYLALLEELPSVFERIAERLDAAVATAVVPQGDDARDSWTGVESVAAEFEPLLGFRGLDRLRGGFDLEDVTAQYSVLRRCVLRALERTGTQPSWLEMTVLHEALDQVIIDPATRSAAARERALGALDRVSAEGMGNAHVDRLLRRLLEVLLESARSVDWAVMLLLEGEVLRMRATIGVDEAMWGLRAFRLAEGFIGRVVRERRPVALRSAAPDPLATDAGGGAAGPESGPQGERPSDALHALYGVPMLSEGRLVGVAVVSSRRVAEFSEGDRLLFRKAAERAAALATQAQLREQLAAERSRFETAIQRLPFGVAVAEGPSGTLAFSNRRFAEIVRGPEETPSNAPRRTLLSETDDDQRARWLLSRALHGETVAREELEFLRADGERRRGSFNVTPVRDSEGRVTGAVMVVEDVTESRKAELARELLSEARALMTASLDHDATLEQVVRLAGERFADLCALDLDDGGGLPRLLAAARPPEARALLPRLLKHPPLLLGETGPLAEATARRELTLVPLVTDPWLQRVARGPEHLSALRELGARSAIVVPLAARGRKLGMMSLWTVDRDLRQDDLDAAGELGRLASLAIELARLHREAARSR